MKAVRRSIDGLLMGIAEASRVIGNSERSLRALVAAGVIPYRRLGSRIVFRRVELEKWIENLPGVRLKDADANVKARR